MFSAVMHAVSVYGIVRIRRPLTKVAHWAGNRAKDRAETPNIADCSGQENTCATQGQSVTGARSLFLWADAEEQATELAGVQQGRHRFLPQVGWKQIVAMVASTSTDIRRF